jgi:hypothetical protein
VRKLMGVLAALVLAFGFTGCMSGPGTGTPCEKCDYGYVTTGKSTTRKVGCIVDGKIVDCMKNPSECPGCKGMK